MKSFGEVEMHIAHGCNLSCESCSHFASNGPSGLVGLAEAEAWMAAWKDRLRPRVFGLLGGEPALHPHFPEHILQARRNWPNSEIWVATNGFLLHRHPGLPHVLAATGAILRLTRHHDSAEYVRQFQQVVGLVRQWLSQVPFRVIVIDAPARWTRRYHGSRDQVLPFDDRNPRRSWEVCLCKTSRQLFRGKLWKCSTIAYLQLQKEAHPNLSEKWDPYLAYVPLEPTCTDEELDQFLAAEEEPICNMCPSVRIPFKKAVP